MNRRALIGSIASLTPLLYLSRLGLADTFCGAPSLPQGIQQCMAGIDSRRLNIIYAPQEMNEWCWAACISMVFSFYGHPVSQQRIVGETWGQIVDMPGAPTQILGDLNRRWIDDFNRPFGVMGDVFSATPVTAAQDLNDNMPLIICSLGHAMVFSRLDYLRLPNGAGSPQAAYVRDPWPGNGERILSPQEWAGVAMLVRIRVS